jgi:hypothetical protein
MRLLPLLALLLLSVPAFADPIVLFDGGLRLEAPALFRSLDPASIDKMFASSRSRPAAVLATPDSETRVSVTYAEAPLLAEDLEETRAALHRKMDAQASITWLRDEMVSLHGSPWFRQDYQMEENGQARRETILGTSLRGRLLFVVISGPAEAYELIEPDLQSVIDSLQLEAAPRSS